MFPPYLPFIDDVAHTAELDRQRFVVLRAPAAVAAVFDQIRNEVRAYLHGQPASYPARAHVTLCGFAAGTTLDAVRELVRDWAPTVSDLRIEVECLTTFPAPFQIVIVKVRTLPALYEALADLRARAAAAPLAVSTVTPVERWTFHMSVAYCSQLSESAWRGMTEFTQTLSVPAAAADVSSAEVVAFDQGREYCGGVYQLGQSQS
jgi:2'-5' RNA ligase